VAVLPKACAEPPRPLRSEPRAALASLSRRSRMPLEATMIVMDNSDYMRNGDFAPSRLEAQQDAVNLLAGAKTQSNPENTVGVLTMAGAGVEVRVAMTSDLVSAMAA